jgi:DnaJ-class molecular chaperone
MRCLGCNGKGDLRGKLCPTCKGKGMIPFGSDIRANPHYRAR